MLKRIQGDRASGIPGWERSRVPAPRKEISTESLTLAMKKHSPHSTTPWGCVRRSGQSDSWVPVVPQTRKGLAVLISVANSRREVRNFLLLLYLEYFWFNCENLSYWGEIVESIAEKLKTRETTEWTNSALTKGNLTTGLAGTIVGCKENKPTGRNLWGTIHKAKWSYYPCKDRNDSRTAVA